MHRKILETAMALLSHQNWESFQLETLAVDLGMSLEELHEVLPTKDHIFVLLNEVIEEQMKNILVPSELELYTRRDRLLEIFLTRFDLLEPYKPAFHNLFKELPCGGSFLIPLMKAEYEFHLNSLKTYGMPNESLIGEIKTKGLFILYGAAFREWLQDESQDLSKTMAFLDKWLREGEKIADPYL